VLTDLVYFSVLISVELVCRVKTPYCSWAWDKKTLWIFVGLCIRVFFWAYIRRSLISVAFVILFVGVFYYRLVFYVLVGATTFVWDYLWCPKICVVSLVGVFSLFVCMFWIVTSWCFLCRKCVVLSAFVLNFLLIVTLGITGSKLVGALIRPFVWHLDVCSDPTPLAI